VRGDSGLRTPLGGLADAAADAPIDAGSETEPAPLPSCPLGLVGPPADNPVGTHPPIVAALRLLDFGIAVDGGRPAIPGFNLDLTCSVDVSTSSCQTKLLPVTFEAHAKDKNDAGLDNAAFTLIEYISRLSEIFTPTGFNAGIAEGRYGGVIRVDDWNGQPNDESVQVEFFPAIGFVHRDAGLPGPRLDPDDVWILDRRYQVGGVLEASTIRSDRAYINDNRLVARFKVIPLSILVDQDPKLFEIRLSDAVVTARVVPSGDGGLAAALENGVLGGRWRTSDFLGEVRTIFVKDGNGLVDTTLCDPVQGAQLIYGAVKSTICDGRDIRSDSQDNAGLPCDAISAAARIETYTVKTLGTFGPPPDGGIRCVDAAIPLGDDCDRE
jgi:hypothetical protein